MPLVCSPVAEQILKAMEFTASADGFQALVGLMPT